MARRAPAPKAARLMLAVQKAQGKKGKKGPRPPTMAELLRALPSPSPESTLLVNVPEDGLLYLRGKFSLVHRFPPRKREALYLALKIVSPPGGLGFSRGGGNLMTLFGARILFAGDRTCCGDLSLSPLNPLSPT